MSKEELLNRMKMCPFCKDGPEWPYTESKAELHDRQGLHSTLGKTWAPTKGNPRYEEHLRWLKLLAIKTP